MRKPTALLVKTTLLLMLFASAGSFAQQARCRFALTPQVGVAYKATDWLYGAPLVVGAQVQLHYQDRYVLDAAVQTLSFKDVVYRDWKATRLSGSEKVLHGLVVAQLGAGCNLKIRRRHDLVLTGGGTYVNYSEPYVVTTSSMILSGSRVEHRTRRATGLYGRLQLNIALDRQRSFLSLGTSLLTCRYLSYGTMYAGYTLKLPSEH